MNIWIAAADNNVSKVEQFLASGDFTPNSKDQNGYTPLHAAAEYGHLDLLKLLIDKGGDINVRDSDGDTPLHACESSEVAKWLISFGADISIKNDEGLTPLQKAEEDADFPDLIAYLRKESGIENKGDDELPENVRLTLETPHGDPTAEQQVSEEQRAELAKIIENGTDADFEDYLRNVLGKPEDAKKRKEE